MKTLSVTEAARSLGACVNRVYSRKESFAIAKFGVPYALLVPATETGCNSHELRPISPVRIYPLKIGGILQRRSAKAVGGSSP